MRKTKTHSSPLVGSPRHGSQQCLNGKSWPILQRPYCFHFLPSSSISFSRAFLFCSQPCIPPWIFRIYSVSSVQLSAWPRQYSMVNCWVTLPPARLGDSQGSFCVGLLHLWKVSSPLRSPSPCRAGCFPRQVAPRIPDTCSLSWV